MDRTFAVGCVCAVVVALSLIAGVTYANANKYKAMSEMVAKGANPMAIHCAIDGVNASNQTVCNTLAAQPATK